MKVLIVYYTYEGCTGIMADELADTFDADIRKLYVVEEKRIEGIKKTIWEVTEVFRKHEPEISPLMVEFDDYDLIILGTPVWANSFTPAMRAFISKRDFNNQKVAYFYVYGASAGNVEAELNEALKDADIVGKMGIFKFRKDPEYCKEKIVNWAKTLINA